MTAVSYSTILFASALFFDACFWKINSISQTPVEIPLDATGSDEDVEHRVAYWREDIGLNLFHWHWHMLHPWRPHEPKFMINKDRRGELFSYLHQQFLARYNVERLCNGLNFVLPLSSLDEPIAEAYNPMLSSDVAAKEWAPRPPNMKISSIDRADMDDGTKIDIEDMKRFRERILVAINRRKLIAANGTEISIDNDQGVDILGNTVEAVSNLSSNVDYYGSFHNWGHVAIGAIHDPQNKHHQPLGVMSTPNTSVRDPLFYRWHVFINDIFRKHRASLHAYDEKDLSFPAVQVMNVELCSHQSGKCSDEKNTLYTYMMKNDVNISRGVDFFPRKPVLVRVTHASHDEFDYTIECVNWSRKQLLGIVRIFILPVNGFSNYPMKLVEQRNLAIEMDRFVQPLKPGKNKIVRRSTMSSVTIPPEQTFRDLDTNRPKDDEHAKLEKFNSCGCGWPHNLLVPRGTTKGYPMILFAMITDYYRERTDLNGNITSSDCKISIFCSLSYKKYPYKRPGGFPFDRPVRNGVNTIQAFLTPNMAIKLVTIFHSDKIRQGRVLSNAKPKILGRGKQQTQALDQQGESEVEHE